MTYKQFISEHNVRVSCEEVYPRPDGIDMREWDARTTHFRSKIRVMRRSYTGYYSQGSAFEGKTPDATQILQCVVSDARAARDAESFEDFCSTFGYDTDSRIAERTWAACCKVLRAMERLFPATYEKLLEIEDEE